jgi:hypothetical protein
MTMPRVRISILGLMIAVALVGALTGLSARSVRNATDEATCQQNLRTIGLALHSYHASHGCLPPAYTTDALGKPLHSWRVLILPFAGEDALYREVRLDEPWNSPHNTRLKARMPSFLGCPAYTDGSHTSYAVVVGPETVFPEDVKIEMSQITDGTANTIGVVELGGRGIPWMDPRDLRLFASSGSLQGPAWRNFQQNAIADLHRQGLAGRDQHPGGWHCLYMDGSVLARRRPAPSVFYAHLTMTGAEFCNPADY